MILNPEREDGQAGEPAPRSPFRVVATGEGDRAHVLARARAYIAREDPAISGQKGHSRAFHVACVLVKGFGLTVAEGLQVIQDWNGICQPPWSEKELLHKLEDADKAPDDKPRGYLLREDCNGHADNGQSRLAAIVEGKTEPALTFPAPIPASQLRKRDPRQNWLWHGYLSRGSVTLLSALWKAGKTTLITHLLKSLETGSSFCGCSTLPASVLYVTEESESRWAERRDQIGLTDHVEFLVRPFSGKPDSTRWRSFVDYLLGIQKERLFDVLVFDTLANLWPVKDENDAAQVQAALMPLHTVIDHAGLLMVHHTRKSDGQQATAARGSGALPAFVDTILELRRHDPADRKSRKRLLTGYGRYEETPDEVIVELGEEGYTRLPPDNRSVPHPDLVHTIRDLLPGSAPGWTVTQILANWPTPEQPRRNDFFDALALGLEAGDWVREGEGRKGSPHRYWTPANAAAF